MISCLHPKHVKGMYVPCNKCVLCKRNDSLNWQVRLSHEALYHTHSLFITLTYDNDSLPKDYSFKKKDVQDWQKRLREHISRKFGKEERIKFFTVPEGGDGRGIREEGKNPHYHSIILGKISAEELKPIVDKTWKF
ncbi:MAG: hypothetical protein LBS15_03165 [Endomicrobium sp.]|nr:hypothetical protein [Endomicrobium sp.]